MVAGLGQRLFGRGVASLLKATGNPKNGPANTRYEPKWSQVQSSFSGRHILTHIAVAIAFP